MTRCQEELYNLESPEENRVVKRGQRSEKYAARGWSGQPIWDIALDLLQEAPRGRLLDAPSGGGYLADQLAERGFQVVGADIVRELWQFPEYPFVCADLNCPFPFQDGSFDVLAHVGGIAHFENPSALLREFHRLVRPGGLLVITMENIFTLESRMRFLLNGTYRWYPHPAPGGQSKIELTLLNREPLRLTTLLFLLAHHGYTVEEVLFGGKQGYRPLLPLGFALRGLTSLHNRMRAGKGNLTPPVVNSSAALHCRHVGVRARRNP